MPEYRGTVLELATSRHFGFWLLDKTKTQIQLSQQPNSKNITKTKLSEQYHHLIFSRLTQRTRGLEKKRIERELEDPGRIKDACSLFWRRKDPDAWSYLCHPPEDAHKKKPTKSIHNIKSLNTNHATVELLKIKDK